MQERLKCYLRLDGKNVDILVSTPDHKSPLHTIRVRRLDSIACATVKTSGYSTRLIKQFARSTGAIDLGTVLCIVRKYWSSVIISWI
jgi:hypothetical protein